VTLRPRVDANGRLSWKVVSAAVVRRAGVEEDGPFTRYAAYRRMHEETLRRWRSEVHETAAWVAQVSAEQAAFWVVGGVALEGLGLAARGLGSVLGELKSPLLNVLRRGGPEAVGWLESLWVRVPEVERKEFLTLFLKVETQGLESLSQAEHSQLTACLTRLELLAKSPVGNGTGASAVRGVARSRFWPKLFKKDPKLAKQLTDLRCEVHHRWPIEYAHILPEADINELSNLVALQEDVHQGISAVWIRLRTQKSQITASEVRQIMSIIDRHFNRWYNTVPQMETVTLEAKAAENAALEEVSQLIAQMERR